MTRNIAVGIAAAAALGALLFAAPQAFAQTAAGTKVSNSATVAYKIGTVQQTATGTLTPAEFLVDRKISLTVTEVGGTTSTASPGAVGALMFSVLNSTNDIIDVKLDAATMTGVDAPGTDYGPVPFSATEGAGAPGVSMSYALYYDTDTSGDYNVGDVEVTKTSPGGQYYIDSLAPGVPTTVFVVSTMPATGPETDQTKVQDGDVIVAKLTGTALSAYAAPNGTGLTWDTTAGPTFGAPTWVTTGTGGAGEIGAAFDPSSETEASTTVENVFADTPDADLAEPVGTASDGIDAAYDAYEIGGAAITVTKRSAVYWDPINGYTAPRAIPGAVVLYCITVKNTGSAAANEITITDSMPTNTAFEKGLTDTDPVTGGVQPLNDGNVNLSAANSVRISTADNCAITDWNNVTATSPPTGSYPEDETIEPTPADNAAWAALVPADGVVGGYNATGSGTVTTTVQQLAVGSTTPQFTTTMFLVKID